MTILSEAQLEVVRLFKETTVTYAEMCALAGLTRKQVYNVIYLCTTYKERLARKRHTYSHSKIGTSNPMYGKFREEHPNYKGVISDGKGYLLILKPDWFTGRTGCKHVFYHHVVYCEANNMTELPDGMVIHHRDGNPHNNDIENLLLCTISQHAIIHRCERATTIPQGSRETGESPDTEALHPSSDELGDDIVCSRVKA